MTKAISVLALLALGISTTDASAEGPSVFDWTITLEVPEQGLKGTLPIERKGAMIKMALPEWQCRYGFVSNKGIEAILIQCNVLGSSVAGNRLPLASTAVECSDVETSSSGEITLSTSGMRADKSISMETIRVRCKKR